MPDPTGYRCPCGAPLVTRPELLATGDALDAYLAGMVGDDAGYCVWEDDVVPLAYAQRA